jgi:hypothetical protein
VPAHDKLSEASVIPIKDDVMTFDTRKRTWWNATPPSFTPQSAVRVGSFGCWPVAVFIGQRKV